MCKCGRLQTAVPSWGLLGAGPRWQFGVADAGTPNYTLPAGSSAVCRAGRHRFCWLRGFWQCLELCFGSGAAVPWSPGVALLRGVTLLSKGENQQFPSSRLFPFWASPVGHVWSVEIRGHGALLGSGARFSHRVFPPGMAEGCWALLPVGTQALFQLSWCWAMGGEAGQARKTTSGEVSRPLGVCRKCCRAGISCSRPWVAGNKQQGAHLEPPPTHTHREAPPLLAPSQNLGQCRGCGAGPGILQVSFLEQLHLPLDAGRCRKVQPALGTACWSSAAPQEWCWGSPKALLRGVQAGKP